MKRKLTYSIKYTPRGCTVTLQVYLWKTDETRWMLFREQKKRFLDGYASSKNSAKSWIKESVDGYKEHCKIASSELPEIYIEGDEQ